MTTITLFGLALAPLYAAIAEVESGNGDLSPNVYQIDEDGSGYIDDVNRIIDERAARLHPDPRRANPRHYTKRDVFVRPHAEYMMAIYWSHWGGRYEKTTGNPVTYEVLARIHNGGPNGWKKHSTKRYWAKVKAVMEGAR